MGTTATAVKLCKEGGAYRSAVIGSVADSRVYHLRAIPSGTEAKFAQITVDDNPVIRSKATRQEMLEFQERMNNLITPPPRVTLMVGCTRETEMSSEDCAISSNIQSDQRQSILMYLFKK